MGQNIWLDGIKKMTPEERKKSREAVLEAIKKAEAEAKNRKIAQAPKPLNRQRNFDAITMPAKNEKINEKIADKQKNGLKPDLDKNQKGVTAQTSIPSPANLNIPGVKLNQNEKMAVKNILANFGKNYLNNANNKTAAPTFSEPKKIIAPTVSLIKNKNDFVLRQKQERQKQEREKQERDERKKKEKNIRRKIRRKKIIVFFQNARWSAKKSLNGLLAWGKKTFYFASYTILGLAILSLTAYIIFGFLLLYFSLDKPLARKLENKFPVPAVISRAGFISFYAYVDLKKNFLAKNPELPELQAEWPKALARSLFLNRLIKKKFLTDRPRDQVWPPLNEMILRDREINQVAWQRTGKILDMIKNSGEFNSVAAKYADRLGKIEFSSREEAVAAFGSEINEIVAGEVSEVVPAKGNLYVFLRLNSPAPTLSFNYIMVEAINLEEYLMAESANFPVWILAKF